MCGQVGLLIAIERALVGERHSKQCGFHDGVGDCEVLLLPVIQCAVAPEHGGWILTKTQQGIV
jgi:hypothetical protein